MALTYLMIKHLHVTCVACSGSFFALRAYWRWQNPARLKSAWVKILPHLIDTMLLISAVMLAYSSAQYPFAQNWLTAKVLALILYIVLGTLALKRLRRGWLSYSASIAALLTLGYIISVAITRTIWPFA